MNNECCDHTTPSASTAFDPFLFAIGLECFDNDCNDCEEL